MPGSMHSTGDQTGMRHGPASNNSNSNRYSDDSSSEDKTSKHLLHTSVPCTVLSAGYESPPLSFALFCRCGNWLGEAKRLVWCQQLGGGVGS